MIVRPGTTSQSYNVFIADLTGAITGEIGGGVTGLTAATFPQLKWFRGIEEPVNFPTMSDLGSLAAAFVEGGVFERGGGYYRVDFPNAAFASEGVVTLDSDDATREPIFDDIQVTGLPIPPTNPTVWYYGNGTSLIDFQSTQNLGNESNQDGEDADDSEPDWGRILRDGRKADAEINLALRGGYYKVPVTVGGVALQSLPEDDETRVLFEGISDWLTTARLNDHRMIYGTGRNATDVDALAGGLRTEAHNLLAKIKTGEMQIDADLADPDVEPPDITAQPSTFQSIGLTFKDRCGPCDELGCPL
jgi:hypothetical protein